MKNLHKHPFDELVNHDTKTDDGSVEDGKNEEVAEVAQQAPAIELYNPRRAPNRGNRNNLLNDRFSNLFIGSLCAVSITVGFSVGLTTENLITKIISLYVGASVSLTVLTAAPQLIRSAAVFWGPNRNVAPQNEANIENNIQPELQNQVEPQVAPVPNDPLPNLVNLLSRTLNLQANFPGNHCAAIFRAIESSPRLKEINNQDLLAIVNRVFSDGSSNLGNLQNGDKPLTIAIEDFRRELGQPFREVNIPSIPSASIGNKRVIQAISCAIIQDKLRNYQEIDSRNLPNLNMDEFKDNCKELNQNIVDSLPVAERALFAANVSIMIEDLLDNGSVDASVRRLTPNQVNVSTIGIRPGSFTALSSTERTENSRG